MPKSRSVFASFIRALHTDAFMRLKFQSRCKSEYIVQGGLETNIRGRKVLKASSTVRCPCQVVRSEPVMMSKLPADVNPAGSLRATLGGEKISMKPACGGKTASRVTLSDSASLPILMMSEVSLTAGSMALTDLSLLLSCRAAEAYIHKLARREAGTIMDTQIVNAQLPNSMSSGPTEISPIGTSENKHVPCTQTESAANPIKRTIGEVHLYPRRSHPSGPQRTSKWLAQNSISCVSNSKCKICETSCEVF